MHSGRITSKLFQVVGSCFLAVVDWDSWFLVNCPLGITGLLRATLTTWLFHSTTIAFSRPAGESLSLKSAKIEVLIVITGPTISSCSQVLPTLNVRGVFRAYTAASRNLGDHLRILPPIPLAQFLKLNDIYTYICRHTHMKNKSTLKKYKAP